MRYEVIHKMPLRGDTVITVRRPIKEIKIGDKVNGGKHTLLSVVMLGRVTSRDALDTISLVVSGDFAENELVY